MRHLPRLLTVLLLLLAAACGQEPATTKQGEHALKFDSTEDYYTLIIRTQHDGTAALKFRVQHMRVWKKVTWGWMYLTPTRLVYEPSDAAEADDRMSVARSWIRSLSGPDAKTGCVLTVQTASGKYDFRVVFYSNKSDTIHVHCAENATEKASARKVMQWIKDAHSDWTGTFGRFSRLVTAKTQTVTPAQATGKKAEGTIVVQSSPGNAQVYLDNRFQGMTSEAGELIVDSAPGDHEVRLTQPGYKEWRMRVWVKAGERQRITATLTPAGPRPLTRAEVGEMLENNVAKPRVISLVKQYGVDFVLTEELERDLRAKGADSDVLVAIATNKK
jgi:hypothetical protein